MLLSHPPEFEIRNSRWAPARFLFSIRWAAGWFALQAADCVLLLFCLCPCQQRCVCVCVCHHLLAFASPWNSAQFLAQPERPKSTHSVGRCCLWHCLCHYVIITKTYAHVLNFKLIATQKSRDIWAWTWAWIWVHRVLGWTWQDIFYCWPQPKHQARSRFVCCYQDVRNIQHWRSCNDKGEWLVQTGVVANMRSGVVQVQATRKSH